MKDDDVNAPNLNRRPHTGLKVALVGAGIAAGAIGATAIGASATTVGSGSTGTTTSTTSTTAPSSTSARPAGAPNVHGAAPVRSDEKAVNSAVAAKLKATALKAVPGGTVYRIETDAGDGAYEAHMTKSDGTEVTVKFDKNYAVTGVETGMGKGDPRPAN